MIYFSYFLMTLLMFAGLFLIGLILLQRGRGGGLAGAFGGMGGQSAFGTKAGDVFTKITIGVASAWILLCAGSVVALHNSSAQLATGFADPAVIKAEEEARQKMLEKAGAEQGKPGADDADLVLPEEPAKNQPVDPAASKPAPEAENKPAEAEKKSDEAVKTPVEAEKKPDEAEKKPEEEKKPDEAAQKPEEPKTPDEPKAEQPKPEQPDGETPK